MEKAFLIQNQAKQNGETVQYYIRDLNTWENEMKQKEAALKGEAQQFRNQVPPVRSRQRREKFLKNKKRNRKRPATTDYTAWETFDADKAYEELDMEEVGPLSLTLDGKQSEIIKQIQLKEQAQCQKERGNKFVKVERWDDAIACYDRAIQLVKNDAIYYANRGLCYLKKDSLHQAESDCTEALRLDPTYVKALQRRATAREKLGSLRAASNDLMEVLKLEPHNAAAKRQLDSIKQRMGTKGRKAKSSPVTSPAQPTNPQMTNQQPTQPKSKVEQQKQKMGQRVPPTPQPKVTGQWVPPQTQSRIFGVPQASKIHPDMKPTPITTVELNSASGLANWKDGVGENVLVIKPVKKPPHLRSKRALKTIPIKEIPLGNATNEQEKPPMRMKIVEINDNQAQGDTNNNDEKTDKVIRDRNVERNMNGQRTVFATAERVQKNVNAFLRCMNKDNLNGEAKTNENKELNENVKVETQPMKIQESIMVPPANSVQFMTVWRSLKGNDTARSEYLSLFEPTKIPKVFANALECDVLSEMIKVVHDHKNKFGGRVTTYLKELGRVKRLSALVMFLSSNDKELLNELLVHCKTAENCSDEDIAEMKEKYEL
ncbi:RNA polymerase II-associated protein 3 isoform X2 [Epargyreus clarus]|uniref:RNA polymerase II-associated protein 3 isoform X2 n=1 Tax=Epargyreus clarus TaxID=520877 RepID=UPI003C2EFFA8